LLTKPFIPASMHSSRELFEACAVKAITATPLSGANMPSCCQAVHFRHLHVHQHDIERLRACVADGRDCRWAAIGGGNAMSGADQQTTDHLLISDSKCIEFGIFG
jgi:hypothetical protein